MKNLKTQYLIPAWLLLFLACQPAGKEGYPIPPEPDYSNPVYWFLDPAGQTSRAVDIFYVYPTLGFSGDSVNGQPAYLADISKREARDAAFSNQRFNHEVYAGDEYNFFAPFYRQRTMNALTDDPENAGQLMQVPVSDIAGAFLHYMTHYNQGRPFMLLGHSQGSAVLLELLKQSMKQEHFEQMVAAYLIGWQITQEELDTYPHRLNPARGSDDTGVIILYNSLTTPDAKSPRIDRSVVGINPLNWKTDSTLATREEHLGIVRFNRETRQYDTIPHFTGAYIQDHYLICTDVDPAGIFNEELKDLFPYGNLHFMDSWLFALNLKANMEERVGAFLSGSSDTIYPGH
ncbi:MAG: DUF3089 domain-containing protein [Bacteroidetes bacterium]|nr:MAG: DUF3089 domain-containing protein [Bacteroidota bacterium]